MLQPKKPAKKAASTVIKPMAKKDRFKNLGGEIGRPTGPSGNRLKPTLGDGKTVAKKGAAIKKAQMGDTIYSKKDRQVAKSMPFKGTVVDRNVYALKNKSGSIEKGVELKRKYPNGSTSVRKESKTTAEPKVKKQNSSFDSEMNKNMSSMKKKVAKTGATVKKCKYGCK